MRLPNAYPVLDLEAVPEAAAIVAHLGRFRNLHLIGRNGLLEYTWLHSLLGAARDTIATIIEAQRSVTPST